MKVKIKRLIAGIMSIMLVITVINFREIIKIGASEVSGYKIDVTYSEDNSIATLTGNTQEVKSDVQLKTLTDANGSEFVPQEFKQEINKNGEYKFILNYTQTIGETVEEKQQDITVKIDGIMSGIEYIPNPFSSTENPTEEQPAVETPAEEQPQTPAETPAEEQPETPAESPAEEQAETPVETSAEEQVESENINSEFPDKLPIEVLKESARKMGVDVTGENPVSTYASSAPTIKVKAISEENQVPLSHNGKEIVYDFSGGIFSQTTIPFPTNKRTYYRALFKDSSGRQHAITALYPYKNSNDQIEWYYATDSSKNNSSSEFGLLIPQGSEILAEYKLASNLPDFPVQMTIGEDDGTKYDLSYWKLNYPTTAKESQKVVFEFTLPSVFKNALVTIQNQVNGSIVYTFVTPGYDSPPAGSTQLELIDSKTRRYSGVFDMFSTGNTSIGAHIKVKPVLNPAGTTKYYGVGLNTDDLNVDVGGNHHVSADIKIEGTSTTKKPVVTDGYLRYNSRFVNDNSGKERRLAYTSPVTAATTEKFYTPGGGTSDAKAAWGEFVVGNNVSLKLSYMKFQYGEFNYRPTYVRIDTYPNGISNKASMVSELVQLPTSASSPIKDFKLSSGAKVDIRANAVAQTKKLTGYSLFTNRHEGTNAYYEYTITVKEMGYAFKVYPITLSSIQSYVNISLGEGIVRGNGGSPNETTNGSTNIFNLLNGLQGSFWKGYQDRWSLKIKPYPLNDIQSIFATFGRTTSGTSIQTKNGYYELYIKVEQGYSKPTITATNAKFTFLGVKKNTVNGKEEGYYHYSLQANSYPAFVDISAKPITFKMTYRDGQGGDYLVDNRTFSPIKSQYYVVDNPGGIVSPRSDGKYFQGFKFIDSVTGQVLDDTLYKIGDLGDLHKVYQGMVNNNLLKEGEANYNIYLAAQWGERQEGSIVKTLYNIKKQNTIKDSNNKSFTIDTTGKPNNIEGMANRYTKTYFDIKSEDVKAYYNTEGRLIGYKDKLTDGKKVLIPSPDSILRGKAVENSAFAELVYMYGVNVQFAVNPVYGENFNSSFGSDGSFKDGLDAFNQNIKDRYYIPAKGYSTDGTTNDEKGKRWYALELYEDNGSVSSAFNPGTIDGKVFKGWKVKTTTDINWIIDGGDVKWLNIYNIATQQPTLWEEVVNSGTITLMPVWQSDNPIINSDDGSTTNKPKNTELYDGAGQLSISAVFKSDDPSADIQDLFTQGKLKVVLVKKNPDLNPNSDTDNPKWQLRYSNITSDDNKTFNDIAVTPGQNGKFTVSFNITSNLTGEWNDGADFRIFAWTDSNNNSDGVTGGIIVTKLNANLSSNPFDGDIPSVNTTVSMLYKIEDKSSSETKNVDIIEDSFTLTQTFKYKYDTNRYPQGLPKGTLESLVNNTNSKIKISLERRTSDTGNWGDTTGLSISSTKQFNNTDGTFSITYTVSDGNMSKFKNNGFRISAWTAANGSTKPSHIFNMNMTLSKVFLEDGNLGVGGQDSDPIVIEHQKDQFTISAKFKYGTYNSLNVNQINDLITSGNLKFAVAKKDAPRSGNKNPGWLSWYFGNTYMPGYENKIERVQLTSNDVSSGVFTVKFIIKAVDVNNDLIGKWEDGAEYRIFAFTSGNNFTIDSGFDLMDKMNNSAQLEQLNKNIPSCQTNVSMLYKIANDTSTTGTTSVNAGNTSIPLTGKFVYDYDKEIYYSGNPFDRIDLDNLIKKGEIKTTLQVKKVGDIDYSDISGTQLTPTAEENGIVTFNGSYTPSNGEQVADFDKATFKITMWTEANNYPKGSDGSVSTAPKPTYEITVTYVADPSAFVQIPKYVNMRDEDNTSFATGSDKVTYKPTSEIPGGADAVLPNIRVEMESPIVLNPYEYNGTEISGENSINPSVYRANEDQPAKVYTSSDDNQKYIVLGILADRDTTIGYPHTNPGYGTVPAGRELGFTLKTNKVLDKKILYQGSIQYRFTILEVIDS